jgi:hypothetical protein
MLNADPTLRRVLEYYTEPAVMTSVGDNAPLYRGLPEDVAGLARVLHGLVIHEHIAAAYGVTLTAERRSSVHVRPAERILDRIVAIDPSPLTEPRPPQRRLAGNCRHFTVLLVSMLRSRGVPARARCGFGGYFGTNSFEDHWVGEYWSRERERWFRVDAQIDEVQEGLFHPDFDLLDVPHDRFVTAGDAWTRCRAGEDDAGRYGLSLFGETGLWWIAGNLLRDVAALRNMEMLPWDLWGAMPDPEDTIGEERLALFDRLAALTRRPDEVFGEIAAAYEGDERVRVPARVRNSALDREEAV